MKTLLLTLLFTLIAATAPAQTGGATLNFTLGELQDAHGNPLADGALLQVISLAPGGGTFGTPSAGSFLGESEVLLWSGSWDSSTTGIPGAMVFSLNLTVQDALGNGLLPREFAPLLIRWYPTLEASVSTPGAVAYGEYNAGWVLPAIGTLVDYTYLSESLGGSDANALGLANRQIVAVPEPGPAGLMLLALLGGLLTARRRRAAR